MDKKKYRFVVVEGMDGVGKSTFIQNLKAHTKEPVTCICFPSPDGYRSQLLQEGLDRSVADPLFVLDFLNAQEMINKALETSHVVCDRYVPSYLVHSKSHRRCKHLRHS